VVHYDSLLYPFLADDFEDHPEHVITETADYHYDYEPHSCDIPCAEIAAERDALADELYQLKLKYGLLPLDDPYADPYVEPYYGGAAYDPYVDYGGYQAYERNNYDNNLDYILDFYEYLGPDSHYYDDYSNNHHGHNHGNSHGRGHSH